MTSIGNRNQRAAARAARASAAGHGGVSKLSPSSHGSSKLTKTKPGNDRQDEEIVQESTGSGKSSCVKSSYLQRQWMQASGHRTAPVDHADLVPTLIMTALLHMRMLRARQVLD